MARDARLETTVGGKYRIVRFLAEGGMGAVYEAQHLVVKRRFAVKFLHGDLARRRDALARFKREAAAAGALESENIAAVVDFGIANDGTPYLVMEYLEGSDLAALLESSGPLPIERATDLLIQACAGMHRAHAAGVVHRDLTPRNLFVCRRGDGSDLVKVVDFGVAKLLTGDAESAVTRTGAMLGTPSYVSPEQARGEADLDHRTDVHALGVILYELLSGRMPHPGDSPNAVIHHIATLPAVPLASQGRELPEALVAVVHRALAANPAERQASAEELAQELSPFAERRVWPARAETRSDRPVGFESTLAAVESAASGRGSGAVESPLHTSEVAPVSGRRARVVSAGLVVIAASLGIAAWAVNRPSRSVPDAPARAAAPRAEPPTPTAIDPGPNLVRPKSAAAPSPPERPTSSVPERAVEKAGRPSGRPASNPKPTVLAPKPADSAGVRAAFDVRNPYD